VGHSEVYERKSRPLPLPLRITFYPRLTALESNAPAPSVVLLSFFSLLRWSQVVPSSPLWPFSADQNGQVPLLFFMVWPYSRRATVAVEAAFSSLLFSSLLFCSSATEERFSC
jgi:hypothetical protein